MRKRGFEPLYEIYWPNIFGYVSSTNESDSFRTNPVATDHFVSLCHPTTQLPHILSYFVAICPTTYFVVICRKLPEHTEIVGETTAPTDQPYAPTYSYTE